MEQTLSVKTAQLRQDYTSALKNYCFSVIGVCGILEQMQNGEIFDYGVLENSLFEAENHQQLAGAFRKELGLSGGYKVTDTVPLQGGRLEYGRLIGTDVTRIMGFARKWTKEFPETDCTLYEMGTYLLIMENYFR